MRQRQVAVIGAGGAEEGSEAWQLAEEVGQRLAEAGVALVCSGPGVIPADTAEEAVAAALAAL